MRSDEQTILVQFSLPRLPLLVRNPKKPQAFVDRGFVVVSINHRVFPSVTVKEMTGAFLILHVADRIETKTQSHGFAEKLKEAGVSAKVIAAEGTNHGTINSNLGLSGDRPTLEMWDFLARAMKKP